MHLKEGNNLNLLKATGGLLLVPIVIVWNLLILLYAFGRATWMVVVEDKDF